MLTAIVMAAGLGRRMGENKLLLKFKGKSIFEYTLEAVKKSTIEDMVVVTGYPEILDYCSRQKIPCLINHSPEIGQSESIRLGIGHCKKDSDFMFFVADQPLLKAGTIDEIVRFYKKNPDCIIVPEYKNTFGNPKIFPSFLRESFLSLTEDVRGSWIVQQNPELVRYLEIFDSSAFFDVDTKEDYQKLVE